jgi:hypothetical protein
VGRGKKVVGNLQVKDINSVFGNVKFELSMGSPGIA